MNLQWRKDFQAFSTDKPPSSELDGNLYKELTVLPTLPKVFDNQATIIWSFKRQGFDDKNNA